MAAGRETRHHVTDAIDNACPAGNFARPDFILPQAADDRAHAQEEYGEGEVQLNCGFRPVLSAHELLLEYASTIDGTEADLHQDGSDGDTPAIWKPGGSHGIRLPECGVVPHL